MDLEHLRARIANHRPTAVDAPRRAAVATVVTPKMDVLFIRRAEHPSDPWSGHMAFPGGRHDPTDADLLHTAVRETREELGLDLGGAELLGRLDDLHTHRTGLMVRPYVFALGEVPALDSNHEVAEVVWSPLLPLLKGERDASHPFEKDGQRFDFPAYDVDGRIVWGLTYRMLQSLFGLIRQD